VSKTVVVIGAGAAGVAAAWSAHREGARVTLVSRGVGASALGGGAVDDVPWEQRPRAAAPLDPDLEAFSGALGAWRIHGSQLARAATLAGRIRPARGLDRSLLDLAALPAGRLLLPRAPRAGWAADSLAAALGDAPFARSRNLELTPVNIPVLLHEDERRMPDGELAARHDDDERLDWLATRLREGASRLGSAVGVLLGPWLGAAAARAERLSSLVGLPTGEVLLGVGSAAGMRFEAARDRLLDKLGVKVVRARATTIERHGDRFRVALEQITLTARAVVLATGGLVGGGLRYAPPERLADGDLPPRGGLPFSLSVDAPVTLASRGAMLEVVSSLHGPELDETAWPNPSEPGVLEVVGVRCDGVRAGPGLTAAGDVIADRPRTLLEAVASGIRAGREAARSSG